MSYLKSLYDTLIQNLFLDIDTSEKEMDTSVHGDATENEMETNYSDGETSEEDMVTDQLTEDMDTFDECVITHDVFMGYSEADNLNLLLWKISCISMMSHSVVMIM